MEIIKMLCLQKSISPSILSVQNVQAALNVHEKVKQQECEKPTISNSSNKMSKGAVHEKMSLQKIQVTTANANLATNSALFGLAD